jgi:hypothetical protein
MSLALSEKQTRDIEVFCEIARENGAAISVRELIELAGLEASEPEFARAFLTDSKLGSKFLLESGYVFERAFVAPGHTIEPEEGVPTTTTTMTTTVTTASATEEKEEEEEAGEEKEAVAATSRSGLAKVTRRRKERAQANLRTASAFGRSLAPAAVLVSVSGANSYLSAGEDEDIDFFIVTRTNGMWMFMLRALILARVNTLVNREAPPICLSCIMDEEWAARAFGTPQPLIFARDALTAKLISGIDAYHLLIERASWMEKHFPVLYRTRLRETDALATRRSWTGSSKSSGSSRSLDPSHSTRRTRLVHPGPWVVNAFLYYTLGSFLRIKSWALNRKLTKEGWHSSVFVMKLGRGHYIFESKRYQKLRKMYGGLEESE